RTVVRPGPKKESELLVIDAATLEVRRNIPLKCVPYQLAAAEGRLYVGGTYDGSLGLAILDTRPAEPVLAAEWPGGFMLGSFHVGIDPWRLYVVERGIPTRVSAFVYPEPLPKDKPLPEDQAWEQEGRNLLAETKLTPD